MKAGPPLVDRIRPVLRIGVIAASGWVAVAATAGEARSNRYGDPFEQATAAIERCLPPEGPLLTEAEARAQAHGRAERGTRCYQSGRCRLPNAYLYDREIIPRVVQLLRGDPRFARSSLWVLGQRRWVTVLGCVESKAQGDAVEAAIRSVDDVEAVIGQWTVGASERPPYAVRR